MRLIGGRRCRRASLTHMVWLLGILGITRDILAVKFSSEKEGVPAPHWALYPRASVLGMGVPITFSCENQ